jgi:pimeloyl-ACP methyl ester carboxylesterase
VGWTNAVFESDIDDAAKFVRASTGADRIFVSGFSRGVAFAYLYAAAHPNNVAGLLLFDGRIGDGHPGSPPPGIYAEDVSGRHLTWENRDALLRLVIANPAAPAPIRPYKNAADNLAHVVYDSSAFGGKGALANPIGGFSDPSILARLLIRYDRYWPIMQDYGDSFTPALAASLARSRIPVLAFSSTNFGRDWPRKVARSAAATGSSDTTVSTLAGWGHLDVVCGTHVEREVFAPAAGWLTRHSKGVGTTPRSSADGAAGSQ